MVRFIVSPDLSSLLGNISTQPCRGVCPRLSSCHHGHVNRLQLTVGLRVELGPCGGASQAQLMSNRCDQK